MLDSGADVSLLDLEYALVLGLDLADASPLEAGTASGEQFQVWRWPPGTLHLQFNGQSLSFEGAFVEVPPGSDFMNLLGRRDFFQRFAVEFWEAASLFRVDLGPDLAQSGT